MTIPSSDGHAYAPVSVPSYEGNDASDGGGMTSALDEHFISPAGVDTPSSAAQPYLEVVAPATLPEGYTFEAEANGHSFTVRVPVGGVEEGQKFSVPFPAGSDGYSGAAIPRASVPVGHWKDGLCDCFSLGLIHPALWNAVCCPLILVGQTMRRLKLTWLGNEGTVAQTTPTFRIFLSITVMYQIVIQSLKYLPLFFIDAYGNLTATGLELAQMRILLIVIFHLVTVALLTKTRRYVREKYGIPEENCKGAEDFCCSLWCCCCVSSQMARHTADYENYAALCCSETGLPPHAPSIV